MTTGDYSEVLQALPDEPTTTVLPDLDKHDAAPESFTGRLGKALQDAGSTALKVAVGPASIFMSRSPEQVIDEYRQYEGALPEHMAKVTPQQLRDQYFNPDGSVRADKLKNPATSAVARGLDQLQDIGYGQVKWLTTVLGIETPEIDRAAAANRQQIADNPPLVSGYEQALDSPQQALTYIAEKVGENLPMGAPSLLTGGAAGLGAKALSLSPRLIGASQYAGSAIGSMALELGSMFNDAEDAGKRDRVSALVTLAHAIPAGLLEGLSDKLALSRLSKEAIGEVMASPTVWSMFKTGIKKFGAAGFEQALAEGATELPQTILEQMSKATVSNRGDDQFWSKYWADITGPAARQDYIESTVAGALAGGVTGAAFEAPSVLRGRKARPVATPRDSPVAPPVEPTAQAVTPPAPPADLPPSIVPTVAPPRTAGLSPEDLIAGLATQPGADALSPVDQYVVSATPTGATQFGSASTAQPESVVPPSVPEVSPTRYPSPITTDQTTAPADTTTPKVQDAFTEQQTKSTTEALKVGDVVGFERAGVETIGAIQGFSNDGKFAYVKVPSGLSTKSVSEIRLVQTTLTDRAQEEFAVQQTAIPSTKTNTATSVPSASAKVQVVPITINAYRGISDEGKVGKGTSGFTFWTGSQKEAEGYAGNGGKVISSTLISESPFIANNWMDAKTKLGLPASTTMDKLLGTIQKAGHDIVIWNHHGINEYVQLRQPTVSQAAVQVPTTDPGAALENTRTSAGEKAPSTQASAVAPPAVTAVVQAPDLPINHAPIIQKLTGKKVTLETIDSDGTKISESGLDAREEYLNNVRNETFLKALLKCLTS